LEHRFAATHLRASAAILLLVCFALCARASGDPALAFAEANRLYEQGKFTEAAAAYEGIRASGAVSPALLFNLGNAWFKAGETGRAIAAYHEALQLSPRDPDLLANLRFARESVGARRAEPAWRRGLRSLTLNEWALLASAALWLWLGMVTVGVLRPGWRSALGVWRRLAFAALFAGVVITVAAWLDRARHPLAVVVAEEAVVRYGPIDESQSHYTLRDGAEVELLDRNGDWFQVRDAQRRTGWVKAAQVVVPGMGKVRSEK
jgi:tetratricopeptide (TPR) repeat protein